MALSMRWLLTLVPLFAQITACSPPTDHDILGDWRGPDSARLEFHQDGTFSGRSLPTAVFFPGIDFDKAIEGSGQWQLAKLNGVWRVRLVFDKSSALPKGYDTSILVSGSGQKLTLFEWIGEAGGPRFEFSR